MIETGIKDWVVDVTLSVDGDNNRLGRLRLLQLLISTRNGTNAADFEWHVRNVLTMNSPCPALGQLSHGHCTLCHTETDETN